jgi:hypothetical protein
MVARRERSPTMHEGRSWVTAPISATGEAILNEAAMLGMKACTSPSTSGRFTSPMPNIGCPKATSLSPCT